MKVEFNNVKVKRVSKSSGGRLLDRDIGRLTLLSTKSDQSSFILRHHWTGEKVPLLTLNCMISCEVPIPVKNKADSRSIHCALEDNSSWKNLGIKHFVLSFQTLEDSSSFLNVVKVCWEAEEKVTAIVGEDSENNEDNEDNEDSEDSEDSKNSKNSKNSKDTEDNEDNEEQFTQQWPESPLFL